MFMTGGGGSPARPSAEATTSGSRHGRIHVHDIQATILHLLGLDHTKLTYHFQGRDFRLTDVSGRVVDKVLA